jgi:hypothetical protein
MHAYTIVSAVGDLILAAPDLAAPDPGGDPNSIEDVIDGLQGWIMGILAAVATLFLVIGGLRYMTAGGDPAQAEQAKGNFKAALAGYALAVLAPVILEALQGILTG